MNRLINPSVIITARLKSLRLPLKVIRLVDGQCPVIEYLINRLLQARIPKHIILATSTNPQDDLLVDYALKTGIKYFRGDEKDVLTRIHQAALSVKANYIVSLTADTPLVDFRYIDKVFHFFQTNKADFVTTTDLPLGTFVYGLKVRAIKRALDIKQNLDTEVWGGYFKPEFGFTRIPYPIPHQLIDPKIRLSIDYPEDLQLVKQVIKLLSPKNPYFTTNHIIKLFQCSPHLYTINQHCQQLYEKHLQKAPKAAICT